MTAPQTIAAIRAYSPTLIAADAERIHVGTAEGCSISIHADNLADMLRTWADAVDEAAGRPPRGTFPLDVIAWLASPPQHYPPAKHWKPERRRSTPIVTGVEFADGRRTIVPDWDAARARAYFFPDAVRVGPARVVFVEDET